MFRQLPAPVGFARLQAIGVVLERSVRRRPSFGDYLGSAMRQPGDNPFPSFRV